MIVTSWLRGQVLGDEPAMSFGAAGDVGAEAMDDARQLHSLARA